MAGNRICCNSDWCPFVQSTKYWDTWRWKQNLSKRVKEVTTPHKQRNRESYCCVWPLPFFIQSCSKFAMHQYLNYFPESAFKLFSSWSQTFLFCKSNTWCIWQTRNSSPLSCNCSNLVTGCKMKHTTYQTPLLC